jgi:hypothetical protein
MKIIESFLEKEPKSEMFMESLERENLESLPKEITIYRGMTLSEFKSGVFGISWTLDPKVAHFFAFTYGRNFATKNEKKMIHKMTVSKKQIFAYLADRDEKEVIFLRTQ